MARVLIVEDDGLVAREMAGVIQRAGHSAVLAADARSAVREASLRPELIVLDLGLPDVPGEALLEHLQRMPETANAPVVVVTGKTDCAVRLQARKPPGLADILLKPVNSARLSQAVRAALAKSAGAAVQDAPTGREVRRRDAIFRLIAQGPDRLASHVYRRLCADRIRTTRLDNPKPLEWRAIAKWALLEGLVNEEEAGLIGDTPAGSSPLEDRADPGPPGSAGERATGRVDPQPEASPSGTPIKL